MLGLVPEQAGHSTAAGTPARFLIFKEAKRHTIKSAAETSSESDFSQQNLPNLSKILCAQYCL